MFDKDVQEIFDAAGVPIEGNEALAKRCEEILAECMAYGSVMMGLSMKRIEMYDSQKQSLIDELKEHFKTPGTKGRKGTGERKKT